MKLPDRLMPVEMNWVDYCDSLNNVYFARRTQPPKPAEAPEPVPVQAAFISTLRETMREAT